MCQNKKPACLLEKDAPMKHKFIVTVECLVKKELHVSGCTEEQARNEPWDHCKNEREIHMMDWRVERVEEVK